MKRKTGAAGILGILLVSGLVLAGCDTGTGTDTSGGPSKYTVTFEPNGGTITSGQAVQEVEEGKYAAIPSITPPANKDADGWTSSVQSIPSPASAITATVTFTAKWKDTSNNAPTPPANPLLGAWYNSSYDEFLVFTSAITYRLFPMKETALDTTNKEIKLGSEDSLTSNGTYHYELKDGKLVIKESYVTNSKGEPVDLSLTRIEDSTKTGVHDIWYSGELTTTNDKYTVLIIRSNGDIWAAIGSGSKGNPDFYRLPYEVKDTDTAKPYIKWADVGSGSTDFLLENNQLTMKWTGGDTTYSKITL
jgi:hypothetical protein